MERFCPQKDWQSFCRGMVTNGMHPEKDIVMGRPPGYIQELLLHWSNLVQAFWLSGATFLREKYGIKVEYVSYKQGRVYLVSYPDPATVIPPGEYDEDREDDGGDAVENQRSAALLTTTARRRTEVIF